MQLSARNQLPGRISDIRTGAVIKSAEVMVAK